MLGSSVSSRREPAHGMLWPTHSMEAMGPSGNNNTASPVSVFAIYAPKVSTRETTEGNAPLAHLLTNPGDVARRSNVMVHGPWSMLQSVDQFLRYMTPSRVSSAQETISRSPDNPAGLTAPLSSSPEAGHVAVVPPTAPPPQPTTRSVWMSLSFSAEGLYLGCRRPI
jgi:hypothetical protein